MYSRIYQATIRIHISNIKFPLKIFNIGDKKRRREHEKNNAKLQKKKIIEKTATNKKINLNQYNNIKPTTIADPHQCHGKRSRIDSEFTDSS